jgi:hypothetical protein
LAAHYIAIKGLMMKIQIRPVLCCLLFAALAAPRAGLAQSKLYMQDNPNDTGAEPSPNFAGSPWYSPDIWNKRSAIENYSPAPYKSAYPFPASANPPWLTAAAQKNMQPLYRDPLMSQPNYIYVRVHNGGTAASDGTEQLHLYWAKSATGLSWPTQWNDYLATTCGPSTLYGFEITKPRRNLADTTVAMSEKQNYINAINYLATMPQFQFLGDTPQKLGQYWFKQNQQHYFVATEYMDANFMAHGSDAFLPWHREFINRYEILLRKAFPTVTLFYWDWLLDPTGAALSPYFVSAAATDNKSLATVNGMGNFTTGIGVGTFGIDSDFYKAFFNNVNPDKVPNSPSYPVTGPEKLDPAMPVVSRYTGTSTAVASTAYEGILGMAMFSGFRTALEGWGTSAHNTSHGFIGGNDGKGDGNMSDLAFAAQDPMFFLLHANADRLWSMWQRQSPKTTTTARYDPASAYVSLGVVPNANMSIPMAPWNGFKFAGAKGDAPSSVLHPWSTTDTPNYVSAKKAKDDSVVFPPIYDSAPLTIPILQMGESVVMEIPWYPPNPADPGYACFKNPTHFCLLARILTSTTAPYGMDTPEKTTGNDDYYNVVNNNRIAQHNEDNVDPAGPLLSDAVYIRNILSNADTIQLDLSLSGSNALITNYGQVIIDLGTNLYAEWVNGGSESQGFITNGGTQLLLTSTNGLLSNLVLMSNEVDEVQVELNLSNGYANPQGQVFEVDLTQYDQSATNQITGGEDFVFDFNQLSLVSQGCVWFYEATNQPDPAWNQAGYDDSGWASGAGLLGYGVGDETTVIYGGPAGAPYTTTYFRHDFGLQATNLYTNLWLQLEAYDGAVAYLNGVEIARLRMQLNAPIYPNTLANSVVTGLAAETFYAFDVSSFAYLLAATNVLAVEVHQGTTYGTDLGFDAALCANIAGGSAGDSNFPPQVAILTPTNGGLILAGSGPVELTASAIDPINSVVSVAYFVDGQPVGATNGPPYAVPWTNATVGSHQISAVATNTLGVTGSSSLSVTVVTNMPLLVSVTSPVTGQMFVPGAPVLFSTLVQETGPGAIQSVVFYEVAENGSFNSPLITLGTVNVPPYQLQINAPATAGMYMLYAVATDSAGIPVYSMPVMIIVAPPSLTINYVAPNVIVTWTPTSAILQQAYSLLGPWQSLTNESSPYQFLPTSTNIFFRAYSP